ncbi:HipA family kinase [Clostridium perfringens]|uniref:HipA family kinase n=1 Tax=Clostridium perfringens TaxID=1502 RepID=UPI001FAE0FF2|nr:HipA family kinase [Clostridium perfringens]
MREIEVDAILGKMDAGVSRPVLVLGDDLNEYILKNQRSDNEGNVTNYDCMFINELLAYQIGVYLDVPMPEAVIAILSGEFINEDPALRFAYRFEAGKYFATEKLKYVENNLKDNRQELIAMGKPYMKNTWNNFFKGISNKEDIAKILAFDILIANFDRYNNEGNILIDKSVVRKIYAIDHGHAFFGPFWDQRKVNCLKLAEVTTEYINTFTQSIILNENSCGAGKIFKVLEQYIDLENIDAHSFLNVVAKIMSINEEMIDTWMDNIPDEWYIDKELQISYYKHFILKQKDVVKHIIQSLAFHDAFTNYKGGLLKWREKEEKSITV